MKQTDLDLLTIDQQNIWHPYSSIPPQNPALLVESAHGVNLNLADGTTIIDGMSSWWAAIHGYQNPVLNQAATDQLCSMSHVMFGGLTHKPAIKLTKKLLSICPAGLEHIFYSDSGSVAVEVAIKMALQYWYSQGKAHKNKLLTWRSGYHGDTFNAMSVCDPENGMHNLWQGILPQQIFISAPDKGYAKPVNNNYLTEISNAIQQHANELAAVIIEPIVQGAGGMCFHNPEYLIHISEVCKANNVLLIFDEIATGFGRTGTMFAAEHANISPDIMCLGKAITGGYLSFAATLCSAEIAHTISQGNIPLFAHGPTFMANPLACSIASASIELLLSGDWHKNIKRIEQALITGLEHTKQLNNVADVRVLGAIGVIEMQNPVDLKLATQIAVENGVWLRPFRNLIYTMPPYICSDIEIAKITNAMHAVAKEPN